MIYVANSEWSRMHILSKVIIAVLTVTILEGMVSPFSVNIIFIRSRSINLCPNEYWMYKKDKIV